MRMTASPEGYELFKCLRGSVHKFGGRLGEASFCARNPQDDGRLLPPSPAKERAAVSSLLFYRTFSSYLQGSFWIAIYWGGVMHMGCTVLCAELKSVPDSFIRHCKRGSDHLWGGGVLTSHLFCPRNPRPGQGCLCSCPPPQFVFFEQPYP